MSGNKKPGGGRFRSAAPPWDARRAGGHVPTGRGDLSGPPARVPVPLGPAGGPGSGRRLATHIPGRRPNRHRHLKNRLPQVQPAHPLSRAANMSAGSRTG
jgi:hypothetical protein